MKILYNVTFLTFSRTQRTTTQSVLYEHQNAKQVVFRISCSFQIFFCTGELETNISGARMVSLTQFLFVFDFSVGPKRDAKFLSACVKRQVVAVTRPSAYFTASC
jgi:hypothetical protein